MCSSASSWQTNTNPFSRVFSLQRWKQKMLWVWSVAASDGVFVTTLIISIQRRSAVPVCFKCIWFLSPHQRCWVEGMISMIKSLSGAYTAMSARHLNTKAPRPACCQSPAAPTPHPSCLRSPGKLCISALGGKHYTGPAQGSVSLNILSWPLAVILLMARVSSSTFIRTSAEGEARGSCFFISERKTKKDDKKQKCVKTCWCFIVWTKDATSLKFHTWFLSLWWYQR